MTEDIRTALVLGSGIVAACVFAWLVTTNRIRLAQYIPEKLSAEAGLKVVAWASLLVGIAFGFVVFRLIA